MTVSGWTLGSRVLGLIRDRMLAGAFGGSPVLGAFFLAFQLPNLLRNLFGEGALASAFLPRYVQIREGDPAAGESFAGVVLTRLAVFLSLLAAAGMMAGAALNLLGPPDWAFIALLAIPQLPYLVFICVAAIMAGTLNGRRHFAVPAAAPVLLNVVLITCLLVKPDVVWLSYAVLVAGIVQCGAHLIALLVTGGVPPARWNGDRTALDELWRAFLPTVVGTGVFQLNVLLDSIIAYQCVGAAAVSFLFFGNRLLQFPMALIGHGVNTAVYPELASAAGKELEPDADWTGTGHGLRQGSAVLAGLMLPATVGLVTCADPLVRALYQTGAFGEAEVARTVLVAQCFALSLAPIAFSKLFVRVYHAHRDQRTPLCIGIATVVANVILNLILVQTPLQEAGLALASGITGLGACVVYRQLLHKKGTGTLVARRQAAWLIAASLLMGAAVWPVVTWWPGPGWGTTLDAICRLAAGVVTGVAVYGLLAGRTVAAAYKTARAG